LTYIKYNVSIHYVKEDKNMLTIRLLEEGGKGPDISWLVWVVLILFIFMVFLGWWASKRLPKNEATVVPHGHEEQPVAPVADVVSPAVPDDLTVLEGIGPKVAKVLGGIGITTFAALAQSEAARVQEALNAAGYKYMDPTGWIEQAALAAKGDSDGLKKLQDSLKGGRKK
jgi:predicted flap endonuclease-1-like 5' DNA nuclease